MLNSDPAYAGAALDALQKLELDEVRAFASELLDARTFLMVRQRPAPPKAQRGISSAKIAVQTAVASSGVQILNCSDNAVELVNFALLLPGGAIAEQPHERGISHCIAHTLLNGCGKRNESRLAALLDRYGMDVSFNTGLNSFTAKMNAPRKCFADAFKLMSEIIASPSFPEIPFEREKEKALEKFRRRRMKPAKAAFAAGCQALFGAHPYGCGEHGTPECVKSFTPARAAAFWNGLFQRNRALMGFSGDITPENALKYGEYLSALLPWQESERSLPPLPEFPQGSQTISLPIDREQTVVMKLLPLPVLRGESGDIFHMLNSIENGMNSELFRKIREDKSLAYSVGTKAAGGFHPGVFAFSAATQAEKIADVETCFDEEINRLAACGITEEEFETARDAMLFRLARASESPHSLLEFTMLDMFYDEPVNALETVSERIRSYTMDHFNEVIRSSFTDPVTVTVHAGKLPSR